MSAPTLSEFVSDSSTSIDTSTLAVQSLAEQVPSWMLQSDIFIFDYGVVVFWNFSKTQEEHFIPLFEQCGAAVLFPAHQREVEELHYQVRPRDY